MVYDDLGPRPSSDTVFLVSGGAKGITAACVVALARRFQSRFILMGRSPYEGGAEPEWAGGVQEDSALMQAAMAAAIDGGQRPSPRQLQKMVRDVKSQREISETLEAVAAAGGEAIYVSADVTDAGGVSAAVAEATAMLGPVTGIVHGAGVLADKLVKDKPTEDFDWVVSVKVDGLRNLLATVPLEQLSFLVLFSSVAGFYGNIGQADYAVANEILNKVAHWVRRQAPQCRVLALDWGPWDGGMVTPALRKQLEARNIEVIPVDAGTALLGDLLEGHAGGTPAKAAQIVVGSAIRPGGDARGSWLVGPGNAGAIRSRRIRRKLSLAANPFLRDHVIGGNAVLPTVCAVSWMVNACEQLVPGHSYLRIDDYRALKGIVFDEALADHAGGNHRYVLELTPQQTPNVDRVAIDALVMSETQSGLPRYHYRTTVTLATDTQGRLGATEQASQGEPGTDLRHLTDNAEVLIEGDELYRNGALFHGPSFQGIDAILAMDDEGLTMRCQLAPLSWETQGQFQVQSFNPYVVDVQLQSLLVWSYYHLGHGGLPLRIGWGLQVRPLPFGAITYTKMRVLSCTARSLVADVRIYDEEGRLCMEVGEAEITLSERLNELFAQNRLPDEAQRLSPPRPETPEGGAVETLQRAAR